MHRPRQSPREGRHVLLWNLSTKDQGAGAAQVRAEHPKHQPRPGPRAQGDRGTAQEVGKGPEPAGLTLTAGLTSPGRSERPVSLPDLLSEPTGAWGSREINRADSGRGSPSLLSSGHLHFLPASFLPTQRERTFLAERWGFPRFWTASESGL